MMNLFARLLKEQSERAEAAKKIDAMFSELYDLALKHGKLDDSFFEMLEKKFGPIRRENVEKLIESLIDRPYKSLSTSKQKVFDLVFDGLTSENRFGYGYENPTLRRFLDTRSPIGRNFNDQIPSLKELSAAQEKARSLMTSNLGGANSLPTIDDIEDMKKMDPTKWSGKNIDDLVRDYDVNNLGDELDPELKTQKLNQYKAYLEYLKRGRTGQTSSGVAGTVRELGVFRASDGLEYDVSKLLRTFEDGLELAQDVPPPPDLSKVSDAASNKSPVEPYDLADDLADDAAEAATDDASKASKATAATDDAAKAATTDDMFDWVRRAASDTQAPPPIIGDAVLSNPTDPNLTQRVARWGKEAAEAIRTGAFKRVVGGELSRKLVKGSMFAEPVAGGLIDYYQSQTNPLWAYGIDKEGNELTYTDALLGALGTVATSTIAGGAIGGGVGLLGGPLAPVTVPAGIAAGALTGLIGGGAEAARQGLQSVMRIGTGREQELSGLKAKLKTAIDLQRNNPEKDYSNDINLLRAEIAKKEDEYTFSRDFATNVSSVVPSFYDEGKIKSGDELRSEAEAEFNARYPQGISGGLAPGKSANEVDQEAADMIISRLTGGQNKGPNAQGASSPEKLQREFGWETPEREEERLEINDRMAELLGAEEEAIQDAIEKGENPEEARARLGKYSTMKDSDLRHEVTLEVIRSGGKTEKDPVQASRERTAQQDADYQAKLAAVEDAVAKKQAEKDEVTAYERQQQKDARAINTGLSQEKYRKTMQGIEDKKALLAAGEKRKEEEKAKEAEERKAKLAKRKKEFDAKMAELDKTIAGGNVVLAQQYPQDNRRSKYGHLVSDGQGWGS
jgi:hypothetical protein